jgi:peptidylprolyl isomerase
MAQAKEGDKVKVHYTAKLKDGTIIDSSVGNDPLEFEIGAGKVIPGFEKAAVGMSPSESTIVEVPAADAYGDHREEMVAVVGRAQLPDDLEPHVGQQLTAQAENGQVIPMKVTEVTETHVTLDANHPLAGQDLTFNIELVEIV